MKRKLDDWLSAYVEYTNDSEAPSYINFWTGVGTIGGALRRKVWLDMDSFKWFPSFYIIFVADPGVLAKSTTMGKGIKLLRKIPGINIGPDSVTWQKLLELMSKLDESFEYNGDLLAMSAMTLASGELGNLIQFNEASMVNFYISMWDGLDQYLRATKISGSEGIKAPNVNLMGCTTPHWIGESIPIAAVGGGFTSRCIFVYGDKKERYNAYPDEFKSEQKKYLEEVLISDLEDISYMSGDMKLSKEARDWGHYWYEQVHPHERDEATDIAMQGYLSRKQTHIHKVAIAIAAGRGSYIIEKEDLQLALAQLESLEINLHKVFSKIGRTKESLDAERLLDYIKIKGKVPYSEAYRNIHLAFPLSQDFDSVVSGLCKSGQIALDIMVDGPHLRYLE